MSIADPSQPLPRSDASKSSDGTTRRSSCVAESILADCLAGSERSEWDDLASLRVEYPCRRLVRRDTHVDLHNEQEIPSTGASDHFKACGVRGGLGRRSKKSRSAQANPVYGTDGDRDEEPWLGDLRRARIRSRVDP